MSARISSDGDETGVFNFVRARSAQARRRLYREIQKMTHEAVEREWPSTPEECARRREILLEASREFLAAAKAVELVLASRPQTRCTMDREIK